MTTERFGVRRANGVTTEYSTYAQAEGIARLWGGRLVRDVGAGWVSASEGEATDA